jgi:phage shock protein PspC (stress-responsive transcriptional regulator)
MTGPAPAPRENRRSGIRRSRTDHVLGGVCAGIARSAGLDPLLLRVAVVAVTVLTGGAGLLAYLAAWVLIPREPAPTVASPSARPLPRGGAARPRSPGTVRAAWSTVGSELRTLAGELRGGSGGAAEPESPQATVPRPRSPLDAADDAATALGDRLRDPQVQAGARRAASSLSQALHASVDEVGRRVRRDGR